MDTVALLGTLVGFDTTSRRSNLALIHWVADYLDGHGIQVRLVHSDDGTKASLLATIGPQVAGGIVLSGHTDVVPVDDQAWDSDPFGARGPLARARDRRHEGLHRGLPGRRAVLARAAAGASDPSGVVL